jgi:hypothetical protein
MLRERRFSKLQTAVLVAIALVMGASFIQPSVAHVTKKVKHLYKHLDKRYERRPVRTLLSFNANVQDSTISATYEQLVTVGTFTKKRPESVVQLTWTGHITRDPGVDDPSFCDFQLRIDGQSDPRETGRGVLYADDAPVSVSTVFGPLSAGTHTVSIWVRGFADSCWINKGGFTQLVIVEELDPTAPGGNV